MEPLSLVIPTFNEAETIGAAIRQIPAAYRLNIIVADGGSTDGTRRIARIAGARVVNAGLATAGPARWERRRRIPPAP
jgi:glycosyltransferase involved in cell wall biosynthesis